jgi:hypothetical protein
MFPSGDPARMGATHFLMKTLPRVASEGSSRKSHENPIAGIKTGDAFLHRLGLQKSAEIGKSA